MRFTRLTIAERALCPKSGIGNVYWVASLASTVLSRGTSRVAAAGLKFMMAEEQPIASRIEVWIPRK
jgi:hypothetical protein